MAGFLIPPWYEYWPLSYASTALASIIFGCFLACACFTFAKAIRQTCVRWNRIHKFNAYLIMVWVEWACTVAESIIGWLFGAGYIQPSFWLFFAVACIWTVEVHCIEQIIINRISLLMLDSPGRASQLKWGVFVIISIITTIVIIIWTPARMQINPTWINANYIWDRTEKGIFLLVDTALNFYFIYLVRSNLISNGLTKYQRLFRFNLGMVFVSVALDVVVLGAVWLPDNWNYVQFRQLNYIIKLHIEMNIAELIGKVAKESTLMRQRSNNWGRMCHRMTDLGSAEDDGVSEAGRGQTKSLRRGSNDAGGGGSDDLIHQPTSRNTKRLYSGSTLGNIQKYHQPYRSRNCSLVPSDGGVGEELDEADYAAVQGESLQTLDTWEDERQLALQRTPTCSPTSSSDGGRGVGGEREDGCGSGEDLNPSNYAAVQLDSVSDQEQQAPWRISTCNSMSSDEGRGCGADGEPDPVQQENLERLDTLPEERQLPLHPRGNIGGQDITTVVNHDI
ncbi:hypothetical protein QBC46DRAFT_418334 [Diplogelasinospora grovesii]|uniref:Transmembrane protein n=1 Tax=Diplogelasinospora grovesii TaxID=303347 RepID=A0AAN6N018_9PEZI|nr:hypothetical protein QBC46DRAFT_418334 [Diplogelasinospora grovesii]